MNSSQYNTIDRDHIWHPFTQHTLWLEQPEALIVDRAEGVELIDLEGRRYLDGVSSLWCNVFGHNVPELNNALIEQSSRVSHSTLLGLSHRAILDLADELLRVLPPTLSRLFFADSGAAAVEAGLRMALEWWQRQASPAGKKRTRFLSLEGSYHGDTLGAVNVGYIADFHRALDPVVVKAHRVSAPHVHRFYHELDPSAAEEAALVELRAAFEQHGESLAACIIEPLVQGAAGIWIHSERYLTEVANLCKKFDVFLIADEVATGFGKTGELFATNRAHVVPDILILGKGLSGGYLPISVAAATNKLFEGFLGGPEEKRAFFYGQTFAGNPLAAAVSTANLRLIRSSAILTKLPARIEQFSSALERYVAPLSHVAEVRQCGFMVGIELCDTPKSRNAYNPASRVPWHITQRAREKGVVIRPIGNVMILMPALAMQSEQLIELCRVTGEAIAEITETVTR